MSAGTSGALALEDSSRFRLLEDGTVFLDADGILLVEFAIVVNRSLRACASGPTDLHYASMDFEEGRGTGLAQARKVTSTRRTAVLRTRLPGGVGGIR
jgi:hypothetical protein